MSEVKLWTASKMLYQLQRGRMARQQLTEKNMCDKTNEIDEYKFGKFTDLHHAACERQDIIGASDKTADMLRKNES